MSYQSPYQPPQTNYPNFDYYQPDALAPARRAGLLMYFLGGLLILSSLCCGGAGAMLPQMVAERPDAFSELQQQMPEITTGMMQVAVLVMGGITFLAGVVMIILGRFVRGGSKAAIIIAIVLSIIGLLGLLLYMASGLIAVRTMPGQALSVLCMMVIPIALLALLLVWLFGAMKSSDQAAQQRYAMQYWQYAQQQQMHAQQGGVYPQQQYPQTPPAEAGGPGSQQPPVPPPPPPDQSTGA